MQVWDLRHPDSQRLQDTWWDHIMLCGIEDQVFLWAWRRAVTRSVGVLQYHSSGQRMMRKLVAFLVPSAECTTDFQWLTTKTSTARDHSGYYMGVPISSSPRVGPDASSTQG